MAIGVEDSDGNLVECTIVLVDPTEFRIVDLGDGNVEIRMLEEPE